MKISKLNLFSTKDAKILCQSCVVQKLESKVICGVCTTVRTMRPSEYIKNKLNYFSVFNMNSQYLIDKHKLDIQYKNLQKVLHPDKYVNEGEDMLKEAQDCSSFVSNAYNILKDDYHRANYLLKLKGLPNVEEKTQTINNNKFLQELMDIQERVEECTSKDELVSIKDEVESRINKSKMEIEIYFSNEEVSKVLEILKSIKFHLTILEQINNKI